ncbi:YlxR family protein [Ornithinimicrobium pekingense]|uniref:YlxR domain-containing protein n=1 Tax=Ornithinimicrobium pekingense TaxID=384677 RepID=A0ABQ2F898_9MICO|nr:YlxR family protein [Ornithinimicrobium pekingense]GGK62012.1 hypothetical protein GCM10011509_08030 [Ornithinimicrobium pekingense]
MRTCVGCRRRDAQDALLRVVAVRDPDVTTRWRLAPDERRRAPGRGAYVHPDPECLQSAIARRAFGRALRLPAGSEVEVTTVQEQLRRWS